MEDLAAAHLGALNYLATGGTSAVLNCGYGHGYSVREVLDMVRKVSRNDFSIRETGRREGDPACLISDNRSIRKLLTWAPQHNDLELICSTAFQWERAKQGPKSRKG